MSRRSMLGLLDGPRQSLLDLAERRLAAHRADPAGAKSAFDVIDRLSGRRS